jgi:hypothetical protein
MSREATPAGLVGEFSVTRLRIVRERHAECLAISNALSRSAVPTAAEVLNVVNVLNAAKIGSCWSVRTPSAGGRMSRGPPSTWTSWWRAGK